MTADAEAMRQLERHGGGTMMERGLHRFRGDRAARLEEALARSVRRQAGLVKCKLDQLCRELSGPLPDWEEIEAWRRSRQKTPPR